MQPMILFFTYISTFIGLIASRLNNSFGPAVNVTTPDCHFFFIEALSGLITRLITKQSFRISKPYLGQLP